MLHVLDFSMGIGTLKALWAVREISSCSAVATDMTILLFPRMVAANVLYTNVFPVPNHVLYFCVFNNCIYLNDMRWNFFLSSFFVLSIIMSLILNTSMCKL